MTPRLIVVLMHWVRNDLMERFFSVKKGLLILKRSQASDYNHWNSFLGWKMRPTQIVDCYRSSQSWQPYVPLMGKRIAGYEKWGLYQHILPSSVNQSSWETERKLSGIIGPKKIMPRKGLASQEIFRLELLGSHNQSQLICIASSFIV